MRKPWPAWLVLFVTGCLFFVAGLAMDTRLPLYLEPFAAGFSFAGLVEFVAGLGLYVSGWGR